MSRHRFLVGSILLVVVTASCSSTISNSSTSRPVANRTDAPIETGTTTDASPASSSSTTTSQPAGDPLRLRSNGFGRHDLGAAASTVFNDLKASLGPPATDLTESYPIAEGVGHYQTTDGQYQFIAPKSRTVCWSNRFCVTFGGGSVASMSFTGWTYDGTGPPALYTNSRATIGGRWSALSTMTVTPGGCYSIGYGLIDGIHLVLQSTGAQFTELNSSGVYVNHTPARADVTIQSMEAGQTPINLYGDC
ncbi:MAG: hypothetical protein WCK21_11480 [Actinomycetota bacterium]